MLSYGLEILSCHQTHVSDSKTPSEMGPSHAGAGPNLARSLSHTLSLSPSPYPFPCRSRVRVGDLSLPLALFSSLPPSPPPSDSLSRRSARGQSRSLALSLISLLPSLPPSLPPFHTALSLPLSPTHVISPALCLSLSHTDTLPHSLTHTRSQECAWAISNATSGGDDMQIKYLVDQVCV